MVSQEKQLTNFFDSIKKIEKKLENKKTVIFLDYDGTLTPIVDRPDLALLSSDMKETVRALASLYRVSIVSGRATDDVRSKIGIDDIYYAGSHGFEILQPNGDVEINKQAQEAQKDINDLHAKLSLQLENIKGALVEHVKYTISVHYRLVSDGDFPKIKSALDNILGDYPKLKKTSGKKVFEIRPKINWHKGKAVEFIMDAMNFDPRKNIAVYIGDDTTDEDAFRVLKSKGLGILVAEKNRNTEADFIINNTREVKKVLEYFITQAKGK